MNKEISEIQQDKSNTFNTLIPTAISRESRDEVNEEQPYPEKPMPPQQSENKPGASHLLYAVEMLIFALIGWAWLALRELMGSTPVVDVIALLSVLVCSVLNLVFALIFYTPEQFKDPAMAFFNHAVCIWVLYVHSLIETTTDGRGTICCVGDGDVQGAFSLRLTFREAFFGGLALHQAAASITLSFLTIFLILASAQARACNQNSREWPLQKTPLAVVCLVCSQQAMFGLMAPVCKDKDIATAVISMVVFALVCMVDVAWVFNKFFDEEAETPSGIKLASIIKLLQLTFEVLFVMLVGVLSAVHVVNLGGGDYLLIIVGLAFLWQIGLVVNAILHLRGPAAYSQVVDSTESTPETTETTEVAELANKTAARFRQTVNQPMLLPGVHELRRARDKKAW